jgi:hypothetical protein
LVLASLLVVVGLASLVVVLAGEDPPPSRGSSQRAEAPPALRRALETARSGAPGRALAELEAAAASASAPAEADLLRGAAARFREALSWRARISSAVAAARPERVRILPAGATETVEAEVLRVDLEGVRVRFLLRASSVERFVPFDELPLGVLKTLAPGLADPAHPRTHSNLGLLRLLRGASREAAEAFAAARRLAPRSDFSLEEVLLEAIR